MQGEVFEAGFPFIHGQQCIAGQLQAQRSRIFTAGFPVDYMKMPIVVGESKIDGAPDFAVVQLEAFQGINGFPLQIRQVDGFPDKRGGRKGLEAVVYAFPDIVGLLFGQAFPIAVVQLK